MKKEDDIRIYLGGGLHHEVYTVKNDKNIVVKIGKIEDIYFYAQQFEKHTDIFPKIYRYGTFDMITTKTTGKFRKAQKLGYVYIEKLNTNEFEQLFQKLRIFDFGNANYQSFWIKSINKYFKYPALSSFGDLLPMFNSMAEPELLKFFNDLTTLVKKLHILCNKGEICIHYDIEKIDLHEGNFGIDNAGNIKCLDF